MKPATLQACKLLHDGAMTLSRIESNGMRIDMACLEATLKRTARRIEQLKTNLQATEIWQVWKKRYKTRANLGSGDQLATILFDVMGFPCHSCTPTGKPKTDEKELRLIDTPFIRKYLKLKQANSLQGTFLRGIKDEIVNGFIHPVFNLHTARTYRSSSDTPNFQNLPIRDETMGQIVRSCFIPRKGHVLIEIDYSGLEVCAAACYHQDPRMINYIEDDTKDLHRDIAAECYMLPTSDVGKDIRYHGKNCFVFPQFYGDYYGACAKALWNAIKEKRLTTESGMRLKKHLATMGITELGEYELDAQPAPGTFAHHIKTVEEDFWHKRFKVYSRWKETWHNAYRQAGYFMMLTGFLVQGVLGRNEVINYPVQGTGFHFLLWSLIKLNAWLERSKMRTLIVGQIHDSIIADVHETEIPKFLRKAQRIMTEDIREAWPWIIVPLRVDAAASPPGASWHEKKKIAIE